MDQKKVNERIAMALLMQCAIVWEHCTKLDRKVTSCELKFSDVWNGTGDYKMWKKCPIGHIELDMDKCEYQDVFDRKMWEMEGVLDYWPDGRWTRVQMFFRTSDTDPQMGFWCGYPVERVFEVTRQFCMGNGCTGLMNKAVFGMDGNGKWARLPEVKADGKAKPKTKATKAAGKIQTSPPTPPLDGRGAATASNEPTFAERLREALLKHYKAAA